MPCDTLAVWAYKIKRHDLLLLAANEQANLITKNNELYKFKADSTVKAYTKTLKKEVHKKKGNLFLAACVAIFAIIK